MKRFIILVPMFAMLAACAPTYIQSPAADMSPQQVRHLSSTQLCELSNNYPWESQTETEIGRRNLNCDPVYQQCRAKGNKDNTPALNACIEQVNENARLQEQVEAQQQELKRQNAQIQRDRAWDAINANINKNRRVIRTSKGTVIQEW